MAKIIKKLIVPGEHSFAEFTPTETGVEIFVGPHKEDEGYSVEADRQDIDDLIGFLNELLAILPG